MKSNKNVLFDKEYVKIKKDTFDSMNKVIDDATNVMSLQPKLEKVYKEVDTYTKSYQTLENENKNLQREIKALTTRNQNLKRENNNLKDHIKTILKAIKHFFRELLQIGNELTKDATTIEIKYYYDKNKFDTNDVYDISKVTTKEDDLFDYASVPSYLKTSKISLKDKYRDDFEINL